MSEALTLDNALARCGEVQPATDLPKSPYGCVEICVFKEIFDLFCLWSCLLGQVAASADMARRVAIAVRLRPGSGVNGGTAAEHARLTPPRLRSNF